MGQLAHMTAESGAFSDVITSDRRKHDRFQDFNLNVILNREVVMD